MRRPITEEDLLNFQQRLPPYRKYFLFHDRTSGELINGFCKIRMFDEEIKTGHRESAANDIEQMGKYFEKFCF